MSEKKIVVPLGMLKSAAVAYNAETNRRGYTYVVPATVEAALRWLSENPIVPTHTQLNEAGVYVPNPEVINQYIRAWQRIMFYAPEPESSVTEDEIISVLATYQNSMHCNRNEKHAMRLALEWLDAFRRGQKSR